MRRALVAAAAAALVSLPTLPAAAHEGPLDPRGGHICRPEGGGASDCVGLGLEVGEYHCHQEPCFEQFRKTGRAWCPHGLPVPIRSDGVGVFPVGEFTPPIRVVRLAGPGHVLEVDRDIEPKLRSPQDCLVEGAVLRPEEGLGPEDRAGFVGAESVRAAGSEIARLDGRGPGPMRAAPYAGTVVVLLALLLVARDRLGRPSAYWETGPAPDHD